MAELAFVRAEMSHKQMDDLFSLWAASFFAAGHESSAPFSNHRIFCPPSMPSTLEVRLGNLIKFGTTESSRPTRQMDDTSVLALLSK